MKAVIIYSSKGNSTKQVALSIKANIRYESTLINLYDCDIKSENIDFDLLVLVCPTYGDEELEIKMEQFLILSDWSKHKSKKIAVCELGLYRGYKETSLGAGKIIFEFLKSKGLKTETKILSIDSLPLEDFLLIEKWSKKIL